MITATELQDWASDLKPILFDINVSMNNLIILEHENSNKFKHDHPNIYLTLRYQQYFILIIQLAKIFSCSKNQKRNINKLCNRYNNDSLDQDIYLKLESNKKKLTDVFRTREEILIAVAEVLSGLVSNSKTIEKVIDLRDKTFAHTDPNQTEEIINIKDLIALTTLVNKIYNSLFGKIFDQYFHFQLTRQWDIRQFIEQYK